MQPWHQAFMVASHKNRGGLTQDSRLSLYLPKWWANVEWGQEGGATRMQVKCSCPSHN